MKKFGRILRKLFTRLIKGIAFALLAIVSLAGLALLIVIQWPKLLINDRTLHLAAGYLAEQQDIQLSWEGFSLDVESPAFMRKRLAFQFKDLCVKMPGIESCAPGVSARAAVSLGHWPPKITELGPIQANIDKLKVDLDAASDEDQAQQKEEPKQPVQQQGDKQWIPAWLEGAKLLPVSVDARNIEVISGGKVYRGEAQAKGSLAEDTKNWRLNLISSVTMPDKSKASAQARIEGKEATSLRYWLSGNYLNGKRSAVAAVHGRITPEGIEAVVEATANQLHHSVPKAELRDCRAKLALNGSEQMPGRFRLRCPVWTQLKIPPKAMFGFPVPSYIGAVVQADLRTSEIFPTPQSRVDGDVSLKLEPVLTPLFNGEGNIQSKLVGVPAEFPDGLRADTKLALVMEIPKFEKLVEHLSQGDWAVPAPLNVLTGLTRAELNGSFDLREGALPMKVSTRLQSGSQKVSLDGSGEARMKRWTPTPKGHMDFDLALTDLQLELPRLDRSTPPRFYPDSRIRPLSEVIEEGERNKQPSEITYKVRVHTTDKPVRLLSNLAVAPVPLDLDVTYEQGESNPKLSGSLKVNAFPVEFFNQKAQVERISVRLAPEAANSKLDGSIRIDRADYTFRILLLATLGRPKYKLISDPPLPEDQIYAVLLTGKDVNELDAGEAGSVGNTRTALSSGIGLASLLVLGATPIESINYDETSKVASANVKVAEGMSVNLGANVEEATLAQVGIRKRLGPYWVIETEVERPTMEGQRTVSTYLKWNLRY